MKLFIPTARPEMLNEIDPEIRAIATIFDGTNIPSYSWMINQCIAQCADEDIIIISADRMRPNMGDVIKVQKLLNSGFGFAGLHEFGFYGMHMDAVRRIGPFDERFIKGEYEDCDYLRRFKEVDIAFYQSIEVKAVYPPSFFNLENTRLAREHFHKKWIDTKDLCARLLIDETYDYILGTDTGTKFMKFKDSVLRDVTEWFRNVPYEDRS